MARVCSASGRQRRIGSRGVHARHDRHAWDTSDRQCRAPGGVGCAGQAVWLVEADLTGMAIRTVLAASGTSSPASRPTPTHVRAGTVAATSARADTRVSCRRSSPGSSSRRQRVTRSATGCRCRWPAGPRSPPRREGLAVLHRHGGCRWRRGTEVRDGRAPDARKVSSDRPGRCDADEDVAGCVLAGDPQPDVPENRPRVRLLRPPAPVHAQVVRDDGPLGGRKRGHG